MVASALNSFNSKAVLNVNGHNYTYFDLPKAASALGLNLSSLPITLKIIFENLLRNENGVDVTKNDIKAVAEWLVKRSSTHEIALNVARVLMQDFTGVPAVVDLAAMRDAVHKLGGNPAKVNPLVPVHLVIDHSVQVDKYATKNSYEENVALEMQRNHERYVFLRWGQEAFDNFKVVPPGTGICHQVNLEYLSQVVWTKKENGETIAFPDTLVGTDSHTTMVNGLAVLGWGVGGIEAEAAMLGQPISMLLPEVIGFKLTGKMTEGVTATDLVLTITNILRSHNVVGKFVEFYGDGLDYLPLADRATIANMAPEYGATCGFFPIDNETLKYLRLSNRSNEQIDLVEAYAKKQGLWRDSTQEANYTSVIELQLSQVEACIAGPKRPQDKVPLSTAKADFAKAFKDLTKDPNDNIARSVPVKGTNFELANGSVVIAAITSCTNTSNPSVMIGAGLVAKKARSLGLTVKPWVKTSLAPGSKVVSEYLDKSGLQLDLDALGFNLVGYGCTTCIGNSGPLMPEIETAINENNLLVAAVLSGNRNFEGRIHPLVKANYLASPMLVVAYALAGTVNIDLHNEPLGVSKDGRKIMLSDIWPSSAEIADYVAKVMTPQLFASKYQDVYTGPKAWQEVEVEKGMNYKWSPSTYINNPPYFKGMTTALDAINNINGARILALFGDSITTDHISPAGNIAKNSPAAKYLQEHGISYEDFNSYGARRGNDEVMVRGTFANIRIKNEMAPGTEGGFTTHIPSGELMTIFDAATKYQQTNTPLVVIAGKEYGTGSSRDWAAKGTLLLGIKAVIAESFERIHRSNLIGMGILPLQFKDGTTRKTLGLSGNEEVNILLGINGDLHPRMELTVEFSSPEGNKVTTQVICRMDTATELEYYRHGGVLRYMARRLAS